MKLCKIIDPNMTDVSKLDHLYHGLKPSLPKEVLRQTPLTPTAFLDYARQEALDRFVAMSIHPTATLDTSFNNTTIHQSFDPMKPHPLPLYANLYSHRTAISSLVDVQQHHHFIGFSNTFNVLHLILSTMH